MIFIIMINNVDWIFYNMSRTLNFVKAECKIIALLNVKNTTKLYFSLYRINQLVLTINIRFAIKIYENIFTYNKRK